MRGIFSWKNEGQVKSKCYHGQSTGIASPPSQEFWQLRTWQNIEKVDSMILVLPNEECLMLDKTLSIKNFCVLVPGKF